MQANITSNIDEVLAKVQAYERQGEQLSPFFQSVANLLLNTTEEAFASETSPLDGSPWEPLSPATLAKKKGKPLYESGKMQDSLIAFGDNSQAAIGFNATSQGYPYPAVHQFGTFDGKIDARPFMPFDENGDITDEVKDGILELAIEHFEQS